MRSRRKPSPERVVAVPAAEVERLAQEAWRATGRAPSPEEREQRIREWVDEEIPLRRALDELRRDLEVQIGPT